MGTQVSSEQGKVKGGEEEERCHTSVSLIPGRSCASNGYFSLYGLGHDHIGYGNNLHAFYEGASRIAQRW